MRPGAGLSVARGDFGDLILDLQVARRYIVEAMRIGQAAEQALLEASAIRFYESAGVLPKPARSDAGYRVYGEADIELMRFVRRLRALELPLDDIREIVRLRTSGEAPCQPVRAAIAREAEAVDDRIAELTRLRAELRSLQERMDTIVDEWPQSCVCHVIEDTPVGKRS